MYTVDFESLGILVKYYRPARLNKKELRILSSIWWRSTYQIPLLLEEWIGEDVERADAPVAVVVAGAQTLRTSLAEQALEISEAGVVRL